jgi:hypothetical protein
MPSNDIFTIYTPSIFGRTSFPLKHQGDPIFYKEFNSDDPNIVSLSEDTITIPNHFFKTGEPLTYAIDSGNVKIGIASSSPGALGVTTEFPGIVYPIVVNKDTIRVALGVTYAENDEYVNITSLGIGTHSFEAFKQNTKCLITINNIIQSPIALGSTVQVLNYTQSSLTLDRLQNIKIGKCLKINDEIVRISSINYDTNTVTISRGSNILGTEIDTFTSSIVGTNIEVLSGNYNIIKDTIYFDEPPLESERLSYRVSVSDVNFLDYSINIFTDVLKTGSQILLFWPNPPQEIEDQKLYYIIENSPNNFSLAQSFSDASNGIKIPFSDSSGNEFGVSDLQIVFFYPSEENTFTGRVFLRSNYDGNVVFDDISEQFTGISSSFELTTSGVGTVGIKSDNGILLINNIFQYPESDEAFSFVESGSDTFVNFVGFGTTGFTGKDYDVNVKGYPRGGIIVSYGTTSGHYYEPLTAYSDLPLVGSSSGIGASISFKTNEYGKVTDLKFTNKGYNYKVGEVLVPLYTTGLGTQVNDDKIHITINEVTKDSFNAWNIGILYKLDDLTSKVDGSRKTFNLTRDGQRISLEAESQFEIDLKYNLLVFVNDVLQIPDTSYAFNGGSIIKFVEPIPLGSSVKIYFYKGYTDDTFVGESVSKLKIGDNVQLAQNITNPPPVKQKERIIKEFTSADVLRTNVYTDVGISNDSSQERSITWTPQKQDLILDGEFISKSRPEQNSGISSITIITQNVTVGVGTTIGITTTSGTFSGFCTSIIGINTNSGIGTLIQVGDYVEGSYVSVGVTIVSIGSSSIDIGSPPLGVSIGSSSFVGLVSYSSSPAGINTIPLTFYRQS